MKPSCWPAAPLHSVRQKWALQALRWCRKAKQEPLCTGIILKSPLLPGTRAAKALGAPPWTSLWYWPRAAQLIHSLLHSPSQEGLSSSRNGLVLLPLALSHRISALLVCLHPISPWHCTVPAEIPSSPGQNPNYNPNSLHISAWSTKSSTQVGKSLNSRFWAEPMAASKLKSQQGLDYVRAVPNQRASHPHTAQLCGSHLGQATQNKRTEVDVQVQSGAQQQREPPQTSPPQREQRSPAALNIPSALLKERQAWSEKYSSKSTLFL